MFFINCNSQANPDFSFNSDCKISPAKTKVQFLPIRVTNLIISSLVKSEASSTKKIIGRLGSLEDKLAPLITSKGINVISSLLIASSVRSCPKTSLTVDKTGANHTKLFCTASPVKYPRDLEELIAGRVRTNLYNLSCSNCKHYCQSRRWC